jgi:hypothetical protein
MTMQGSEEGYGQGGGPAKPAWLLEKGDYRAVAKATRYAATKSGNEELAIKFELTEPGFEGKHVVGNLYCTGQALEKITPNALKALGFVGDFFELTAPLVEDATALLPNEVSLAIEPELYDGKWKNKVQWINPIGGGELNLKAPEHPLDVALRREAAVRMNALLGGNRKPAPRGGGPAGSTPAGHTSSKDARDRRGAATPAGSGVQEPPPGRFPEGDPIDDIPF